MSHGAWLQGQYAEQILVLQTNNSSESISMVHFSNHITGVNILTIEQSAKSFDVHRLVISYTWTIEITGLAVTLDWHRIKYAGHLGNWQSKAHCMMNDKLD